MDYLGLFCLGVFVGTVASFGMHRVQSLQDWQTVLGLTLPAVLSGAAMVFIDRFKYSPGFGCYPLGLAVSLAWAYTSTAVENVKSEKRAIRWLGKLHLGAAVLITVAGSVVAVVPAYLQLRAEAEIPVPDRIRELALQRQAAREAASAPASAVASSSASGGRRSGG